MSGVVRRAFRERGHDAWSCDILPAEDGSEFHFKRNVLEILNDESWDMAICFPPCTHLCVSGARWFKDKKIEQKEAITFFNYFTTSCVKKVVIENPIGIMSSQYRKPDQIIQPWMFGHGETKATCLWLKGLPLLTPTNIVDGREARIHKMAPGPNRSKERSRTFEGIGTAMATQWG